MSTHTPIFALLVLGSLGGCVSAADPDEAVDPTPAACEALCGDFKAEQCYDAARFNACLSDCDVATADQIEAWTNCNQPACDPECVLVPEQLPAYQTGCEEDCEEWQSTCGGPSGPLTLAVCEGACEAELFAKCLEDLGDICDVRDFCFDSPGLPSLPGLP